MPPVFAVLPYIKTKDPFHVAGVTFRRSRDTEGLTQEEADHLKAITSLFYLADDKPIEECVYAIFPLTDERVRNDAQFRKIRAAHTILTFLVMHDPYDNYEQFSIYVLIPSEVFAEGTASFVQGYSVTINWLHWLEIAQNKRLYPPLPSPNVFIPAGGSLSDLNFSFEMDSAIFYGLQSFVDGDTLSQPEQVDRFETVLRTMSWYNRSFSLFASEEEEVIQLAIAFEIIFHQPRSGRAIKDEIKAHLNALFGAAPRLNEWVDQFYGERSSILHEGFSTRLRFVASEGKPTERQLLLDSLVHYGRRLLRMCLFNILHASLLAERTNLGAWFIHDEEKLQNICKQLGDETIPAEQRLDSVLRSIFDLEVLWAHYYGQRDVELKTLHAAGKKLIETHLEVYSDVDVSIRQHLEKIVGMELDAPIELIDAYSEMGEMLSAGLATHRGKYWPQKPPQALAHFAQYAGSHHFKLKAHQLTSRGQSTA